MLIHRTALTKNKLSLLIFLPMALLLLSGRKDSGFTREKNGDFIIYKRGNFVLSSADTVKVFDGDTRNIETRIDKHDPSPIMVNGKKIITNKPEDNSSLVHGVIVGSTEKLTKYLVNNTKSLLKQLDDGTYLFDIMYVIIDEHGRLAYYQTETFENVVWVAKDQPGGNVMMDSTINKKMNKLLQNAPEFEILHIGYTSMPYRIGSNPIVVKNHKIISY